MRVRGANSLLTPIVTATYRQPAVSLRTATKVPTPPPAFALCLLSVASLVRRSGAAKGVSRRNLASVSMSSPSKKQKTGGDSTKAEVKGAVRDCLAEVNERGEFKRVDAQWRRWITEEPDAEFPAEAGRYHLYSANACPWANRCHCIIKMKGLEDVISVSVAHPTWQFSKKGVDTHAGWIFKDPKDPPVPNQLGFGAFDCEGCIPDFVNNCTFVRDVYELAKDTGKKYSVPVLWDKKKQTIVSNESSEIVLMLNKCFNKFAKNPTLDLFPERLVNAPPGMLWCSKLRKEENLPFLLIQLRIDVLREPASSHVTHIVQTKEMDELNDFIYPNINNGVYKCGFAKTQEAYEEAYNQLFESLEKAEAILSKQRYLCGDTFTGMDLKLYMTLVRFDPVYVVYFKCYGKRIEEYPNLWNFVKELYQMPSVQAITNMKHIKTHYFTSHPTLNACAVIPARKDADMTTRHDRDRFPGKMETAA
mmetsp:Transcript_27737/g.64509  ORF Transcript_27737/g.64509 Transcript_27737/m.64509 type:complete len:476 (-) Transcript_27737:147-1574(-)